MRRILLESLVQSPLTEMPPSAAQSPTAMTHLGSGVAL